MLFNFGGGIHGHPDGTAAGAKAIVQSLEATLQGVTLTDASSTKPELKKALEKWMTK